MRAFLFITIPIVAMVAVIVALWKLDVPLLWGMVAGVSVWGILLVLLWPHRS